MSFLACHFIHSYQVYYGYYLKLRSFFCFLSFDCEKMSGFLLQDISFKRSQVWFERNRYWSLCWMLFLLLILLFRCSCCSSHVYFDFNSFFLSEIFIWISSSTGLVIGSCWDYFCLVCCAGSMSFMDEWLSSLKSSWSEINLCLALSEVVPSFFFWWRS